MSKPLGEEDLRQVLGRDLGLAEGACGLLGGRAGLGDPAGLAALVICERTHV